MSMIFRSKIDKIIRTKIFKKIEEIEPFLQKIHIKYEKFCTHYSKTTYFRCFYGGKSQTYVVQIKENEKTGQKYYALH